MSTNAVAIPWIATRASSSLPEVFYVERINSQSIHLAGIAPDEVAQAEEDLFVCGTRH